MTALAKVKSAFKNLSKQVEENYSNFTSATDSKTKKSFADKHQELFNEFRDIKLENPTMDEQAEFTTARNECFSTIKSAYEVIKNFKMYDVSENEELPGEDRIKAITAKDLINKINGSAESEKAARDAINAVGYRSGKLGEKGKRVVSLDHPAIIDLWTDYDIKSTKEQQKVSMEIMKNQNKELRDVNRFKELVGKRIPEKINRLGSSVDAEILKVQATLEEALKNLK